MTPVKDTNQAALAPTFCEDDSSVPTLFQNWNVTDLKVNGINLSKCLRETSVDATVLSSTDC